MVDKRFNSKYEADYLISQGEGMTLAKNIRATAYVETSALDNYGTKELQYIIAAAHLSPLKKVTCKQQ
jgi:hypothetical protein